VAKAGNRQPRTARAPTGTMASIDSSVWVLGAARVRLTVMHINKTFWTDGQTLNN